MTTARALSVDVHLGPDDVAAALKRDARRGLLAQPKELPPKWFYDDLGSLLFEAITRLPEYYPARREREILHEHAADVAAFNGADTVVELGSGSSEKTRVLLDALAGAGTLRRFVPFDVSEGILRAAGAAIADAYPELEVHGVVGDFEQHLGALPGGGRRLVVFLGGTIGNLQPEQRKAFLSEVAGGMERGDALLLGTDLVKEPARLVAAYDDAVGVTAAFNRNLLSVLNRELGADFAPRRYAHVARWNGEEERMEMHLRSLGDQEVELAAIDTSVGFADGEEMRTEVSAKFRRPLVEAELGSVGLEVQRWWTDVDGEYALSLSTR
ncbi:MAG TPA: L-histidine N(alpha)-methyltransferase [Acidimicrobiales bacterium]|nr:L-histidine N(alpha)-methyltransferase [Acidimicrobiales bacterium]